MKFCTMSLLLLRMWRIETKNNMCAFNSLSAFESCAHCTPYQARGVGSKVLLPRDSPHPFSVEQAPLECHVMCNELQVREKTRNAGQRVSDHI